MCGCFVNYFLAVNSLQTLYPTCCRLNSLQTAYPTCCRVNCLQTVYPTFCRLNSLQTVYPSCCRVNSLRTVYHSCCLVNSLQTVYPSRCRVNSLQTAPLRVVSKSNVRAWCPLRIAALTLCGRRPLRRAAALRSLLPQTTRPHTACRAPPSANKTLDCSLFDLSGSG